MHYMKTLLIIGYVWPEPNSSAAGARMLQLIRSFQLMGFSIHYASPAQASPHAINFSDFNIKPHSIEVNHSGFDGFCQALNPQVVLFDRFMMEEQFAWRVEKTCPNALRILDTEDLHGLRYARQALAKNNDKVITDVALSDLLSERFVRELAAIYRCDLTLMISQYEMELLRNTIGVPNDILHYLPFMLDQTQPSANTITFEQRQHFVSIGNFRHEPNWDAVVQLKQTIWPIIKKALPQAQLHIYGAYPPKKATQLHNQQQGFFVKGWCEDAFEVLRRTRVLLAPLRFGAGLKGKLLDAAQCGTPMVTTSIGAEGIFQEQYPEIKADDFNQFAEQAIALYNNPENWHQAQQNGHDMLKQFTFKQHHEPLAERIEQLLANTVEHRLHNITGAMLRHNSMKSTQYMSQWIEVKNQLAEQSKG